MIHMRFCRVAFTCRDEAIYSFVAPFQYQRMSLCSSRDSHCSLLERDNVILSKAVRKEKRRQREKRESGVGCKEKVYAEIKPGPSSSEYSPNSTSRSIDLQQNIR